MRYLVFFIVLLFLMTAAVVYNHVRHFGKEPPFRTEDHKDWPRCRWLGLSD